MSLLTMAQNVSAELGLGLPMSVVSSSDTGVLQLLRLIQREGDELARDYDWSFLRVTRTFTCISSAQQTEPPSDWERFADNSGMWNKSRLFEFQGPVDADVWQSNIVRNASPYPQIWRMLGGKINIWMPAPGEQITYEYVTANWILAADGVTAKAAFTADTDTAILPERVIELGVLWRWKRAKGFDYGEELESYERAKESEIGSDKASSPLALNRARRDLPNNFWPGNISVT